MPCHSNFVLINIPQVLTGTTSSSFPIEFFLVWPISGAKIMFEMPCHSNFVLIFGMSCISLPPTTTTFITGSVPLHTHAMTPSKCVLLLPNYIFFVILLYQAGHGHIDLVQVRYFVFFLGVSYRGCMF